MISFYGARQCCVIELGYQFLVFLLLFLLFVTLVVTPTINPSVNLNRQVNQDFLFHCGSTNLPTFTMEIFLTLILLLCLLNLPEFIRECWILSSLDLHISHTLSHSISPILVLWGKFTFNIITHCYQSELYQS